MNMDQLFNDPKFKQALFDVQRAECERYEREMEASPPHIFSPEFEQKMERLINAQQRPLYRYTNTKGKKAVLALAAVFVLLATLVLGVSAIREPVVRFFVEVYEKYSQVFFQRQQEEEIPAVIEVYYKPSWLPEGYEENPDKAMDAIIFCETIYADANGSEVVFIQHTIDSYASRIDTEGVPYETVYIIESDGLYFSNKGIQRLTWNNEQYGFTMSGPVSKDDLLRMAGSIQAE